jgi:dihydrofolate reductase
MEKHEEGLRMRKTVAGILTTLDGVVEAPEKWHLRYYDDELGEILKAWAANADALLLGRRTYEEFAAFWPTENGGDPMADYMNDTPKHVVSTTLRELSWRSSSLIDRDVAESVGALKREQGRNILIYGSPTLVRSLLRDGLLDELDLLVHPIVVGGGRRLFENGNFGTALRLVDSRTLGTGVVALTYVPAGRREMDE